MSVEASGKGVVQILPLANEALGAEIIGLDIARLLEAVDKEKTITQLRQALLKHHVRA